MKKNFLIRIFQLLSKLFKPFYILFNDEEKSKENAAMSTVKMASEPSQED